MKFATILILTLTALIMCSENEYMRSKKRNRNDDKKLSEAFKKIIDIVEEYKKDADIEKKDSTLPLSSPLDINKTSEEKSKEKLSKLLGEGSEKAIDKSFQDVEKKKKESSEKHEELKTLLQDKSFTLKELLEKQSELYYSKKNNSQHVSNQVSDEKSKEIDNLQKPVANKVEDNNKSQLIQTKESPEVQKKLEIQPLSKSISKVGNLN